MLFLIVLPQLTGIAPNPEPLPDFELWPKPVPGSLALGDVDTWKSVGSAVRETGTGCAALPGGGRKEGAGEAS